MKKNWKFNKKRYYVHYVKEMFCLFIYASSSEGISPNLMEIAQDPTYILAKIVMTELS
jgi:hypothetical protein